MFLQLQLHNIYVYECGDNYSPAYCFLLLTLEVVISPNQIFNVLFKHFVKTIFNNLYEIIRTG